MRRVLCVWLPNWTIQRLQQSDPALQNRPLVVLAEHGSRGLRVTACSPEAAQCGVQVGWPVSEARAMLAQVKKAISHQRGRAPVAVRSVSRQTPAWKRADPAADRRALQDLAQVCQRYTPLVGLEEVDAPEALLLDIAGCAHLHGNERGLLAALTRELTEAGYEIRTAIADTIGAAWALTHAGTNGTLLPPGDPTAALQALPVAALRLEATVVATLTKLDLRTIGQLLTLPKSSLPARFGKDLVRRLDQAWGRVHESFSPERWAEPITAAWSGESPVQQQEVIEFVFGQLLRQLLADLAPRRAGILELACEIVTEHGQQALPLRLSRPATDEKHLRQLFQLACERQAWSAGMLSMRLQVQRAGWHDEHQTTLFEDDTAEGARELLELIERLSSRLGEEAVLRPVPQAESLPEWSWREEPWLTTSAAITAAHPIDPLVWGSRPWRMEPTPIPMQAVARFPEGPPQRILLPTGSENVARWWGPERIETGWWRKTDLRRDYYRVETEHGAHYWVFRHRETGQWFLHGRFD